MRDTDWTPSIVPGDDDRDTCLVVNDFGRRGRAWCETDVEATDLETVIQVPVRVVSFNTGKGWSRDISANVAEELRRRCELQAREIPPSLAGFFRAARIRAPAADASPALSGGWLSQHESWTYVKFTPAGAELFA